LGFIRGDFLAGREEIRAFLNKSGETPRGAGDERELESDGGEFFFDDSLPENYMNNVFSLVNMYSNKDDGYMSDRQGLMTEIGGIMYKVIGEKSGQTSITREIKSPQKPINMASDFYEDSHEMRLEAEKIPPEKVAEAERAIMEHLRGPYSRMARGMSHLSDWVHINASVHVQDSRVTYTFIHEGMGEIGRAGVTLGGPDMAVSAINYGIGKAGDGRDPEREELMREISAIAKEAFGAAGALKENDEDGRL
jgi:hypothetical protein